MLGLSGGEDVGLIQQGLRLTAIRGPAGIAGLIGRGRPRGAEQDVFLNDDCP